MLTRTQNFKPICRLTFFCRACVFLLLMFGFNAAVFAKPLPEYRKNVEAAKKSVIELLYPNEEDLTNRDYPEFERQTLRQIRTQIPASEKIEWQGAEIETNNRWLAEKLNEFEKEPGNSANGKAILTEIGERLAAIEQKLKELENFSAQTRTKDEDKSKLAEILRREEYQKPQEKEESLFQKLYRRFMEWLREKFPRADLPEADASGFRSVSFVLQMLLYALVLGIIGFLIRRFVPFLLKRFQNREKREKRERVILGERLAAEETARNLFDEAEKLALTGDLREAIRKGYIALLCDLADRKIIGLSRNKTNRDYLKDVRKRGELYENVSKLTSNFERHWYGFNKTKAEDWEEFKNGYNKTVNESR